MTRDELVALRKSLGLTQAEIGERIGLKLRSLLELEAGKPASSRPCPGR